MGLERSNVNQCIYFKISENEMAYVAIYVDDVLIFSNNLKSIESIKMKLASKFKMKDMGEVTSILGMNISRAENFIKIDQSCYISEVPIWYEGF